MKIDKGILKNACIVLLVIYSVISTVTNWNKQESIDLLVKELSGCITKTKENE
jgi:hypothetical protein